MTGIRDTSAAAAALQAEIHSRMTGVQRLALAFEMTALARELSLTRLRKEHPNWSDAELKRELLRYAFGSGPLPPPLR